MDLQNQKSYDRLAEETESAWIAFTCYRDKGVGRTIAAATIEYKTIKGNKGQGASKQITGWRKTHRWDERSRQYDLDREKIDRDKALASIGQEIYEGIDEYRVNTLNLAKSDLTIGALSRSIVQRNLVEISEKEVLDTTDTIELKRVSDIAVNLGKVAANYALLTEKAYHIERLLEQMMSEIGDEG